MSAAMLGQQLVVTIVQAEGLKHMNNFSGDHPYVVCEVKHEDRHAKKTTAQTKPVTTGDTLNPVWNEALMLDPWTPGESLEFTIYDKGLLGSKTEGKALLSSEMFYPQGFSGMLQVSGSATGAALQVDIKAMAGGSAYGGSIHQSMAGGSAMQEVVSMTGVVHEQQVPANTMLSGVAAPAVTYQAPQAYTTSQATPTASIAYQAAPPTPSITYAAAPTYTSGMTYAAPASTVTYTSGAASMQAPMTYSAPQTSQPYVVPGGITVPAPVAGPQRLAVSILQAHGLQHMNNFTGDHPYVMCEVKHLGHHERTTRVETSPVTDGDVLNPFWGETHHLDPWHMGEALEFTVYDKGLIGSKTEGKVILPSEYFQAQGFSGMLQISGLPHALLHVIVRPTGPSAVESAGDPITEATKTKSKKLKKNKKSKGCC